MPLTIPDLDLRPLLDLRERFERRLDHDFSGRTDDGVSDLFGRYRAGFEFADRSLSGRLVYQYGHGEDWRATGNRALWRSDLIEGYAKGTRAKDSLTLGRQRLSFGTERLLGQRDWNNTSIAWDAARVGIGGIDLFAARSGVLPTPDETASLLGGVAATRVGQTLAFYDRDGRRRVDEITASQLYRGRARRIAIEAEVAGQTGHRAGRDVLAGAFEAIATASVARRLTFSAQGSVASGGGPGGTSNTFAPPYPSTHDHYGLVDLVRWENLRALGLWFGYEADRRTRVRLEFHDLNLDSSRDAWYDASTGAPYRRLGGTFDDPTGSRGRHLGDDYDLDLSRSLNARQSVRTGIGLFRPGHFVSSFNGAATRGQVWGYAQYAYCF